MQQNAKYHNFSIFFSFSTGLYSNRSRIYRAKLLNYFINGCTQHSGFIKFSFSTRYGTKQPHFRLGRSRSHESEANAHPQNSLLCKDTKLKTTQAFLKNTCELYTTSSSLSEEVRFSIVRKFSSSSSAPAPTVAPALFI